MTAVRMDGEAAAAALRDRLAAGIVARGGAGPPPGLATVLVGEDYAARAYERRLAHLARAIGCHYVGVRLPEDAEQAECLAAVGGLNADPRVSGILVLRPLPPQVSEVGLYRVLDPAKDIEAMHPLNAGLLALGRPRFVPSTPASCFFLLDRYLEASGRDPAAFYRRATVAVVGRSNNVGKPAALLALSRHATVVSCDEHTHRAGRLAALTRQAQVVVVAAGVPGLIDADHVAAGAIVVDVGINPVKDPESGRTRLVGDVDPVSVADRAEALSPVPGGVGPVTDVWLVYNAMLATRPAGEAHPGAVAPPVLPGA